MYTYCHAFVCYGLGLVSIFHGDGYVLGPSFSIVSKNVRKMIQAKLSQLQCFCCDLGARTLLGTVIQLYRCLVQQYTCTLYTVHTKSGASLASEGGGF
jgi:hypothetical protein